jgi:hypothetical protein
MVEIVARPQSTDMRDALGASLGVTAGVGELGRTERCEESDIRPALRTDPVDRIRGRDTLVPADRGPPILIESLNLDTVGLEDPAHAIAHDDLGVREMSEDLLDRLLARRRLPGESARVDPLDQRGKRRRRRLQHGDGVTALEITQDPDDVLLGRFRHATKIEQKVESGE